MELKNMLIEALSKVEKELADYDIKDNKNCNLSKSALFKIKLELKKMLVIMDKSKYQPSYSRFLLDYPDTQLTRYLIEVSYLYKKKQNVTNMELCIYSSKT